MESRKLMNGYPMTRYVRETFGPDQVFSRAATYYSWMDSRRTCRDFCDKPIDKAVIENIILTAATAPSGAHKQPWTFLCSRG